MLVSVGALVAWPERFNHDELSAVQHVMNLKLQDEAAFFAEYQNEPFPEEVAGDDELTTDQIAGKLNRMKRGEVPVGCNHLTAFIDVQANLLFYVIAAWEDDFTGYVLDYGTFPDQKRPYFTLRDARLTLAGVTGAAGLEGAIYAGLEALTANLLGRGRTVDEWKQRPERGDNHWLDCLVGCAVAASMLGAVLPGTDGTAPARRERVSFARMQKTKRR